MIDAKSLTHKICYNQALALQDILTAFKRLPLVLLLAYQDLKQRYRRSLIGPFWLTITMSVMIASIGLVFGQIFHTPMREYLPFLTGGMIFWGFTTTVLTEGCQCFIASEPMIKQLSLPLFLHILRVLFRNIFILGHHLCIFPIVCLSVGADFNILPLMSIFGFFLLLGNLLWISLLLGIVCTRYRDLPQIITNFLQVLFYITPIMWLPSLLPERMGLEFLDANPFYHLIEIVRSPLLGVIPNALSIQVALWMLVGGWLSAFLIYARYKRMIVYWI